MKRLLVALVLLASMAGVALAGDRSEELFLGASYQDTDGVGKTGDVSGELLFGIGQKQEFQFGPVLDITYVKLDDCECDSFLGYGLGGAFYFNIKRFFLGAEGVTFIEDSGDLYDYSLAAKVGFKIPVGNSGTIRIALEEGKLYGADELPNADTTKLEVALGIRF